jgi:hypothetical protein
MHNLILSKLDWSGTFIYPHVVGGPLMIHNKTGFGARFSILQIVNFVHQLKRTSCSHRLQTFNPHYCIHSLFPVTQHGLLERTDCFDCMSDFYAAREVCPLTTE